MPNSFRVFEELMLWIPGSRFQIPDSGFRIPSFLSLGLPTELKNDCTCDTSDPVGEAVGAKIST